MGLNFLTQAQIDKVSQDDGTWNSNVILNGTDIMSATVSRGWVRNDGSTVFALVAQRYIQRYLVIPNFLPPEDAEALLKRSKELLDEFNIEDHPLVSACFPEYEETRLIVYCLSLDQIHNK